MESPLSSFPDVDEQLSEDILDCLSAVEQRLGDAVSVSESLMNWTARHLLEAGGKRLRPLMVLLAGAVGDMRREEVLDAACLVELTHLASLYHDDVMDSAPTRRGTTSAHEVWGNSVAILTGDFLFARASGLSSRLGPDVVALHARTFERLCMGQLHETVGPGPEDDPFDHYLSVLSDKTASLLSAAGELGAITSGAGSEVASVMRAYGEKAGVAFQLADDVLDLRSDARTSGKNPGTDLREGIPTMPTLLVRRRHAERPDEHTHEIVSRLDGDLTEDADLAALVDLLRRDPAVGDTLEMAHSLEREAIEILEHLPDVPARSALIDVTRGLVDRDV
ncbi:geranylgeranyl pyrophosphate synthase [Brachybacterium endophyticum]|uniref:Geranylgeranyl pyrophosphate synthase n=1 Tax=Brachybacterium endophyticum TaxID=2182385 RepID=A0A2U2RGQ8_9MICO|nr:polyprenyl synthetase family protein [Brachybacterium endophyticum]PWH05040.1 geranylgeranyl pyrophosphate synthase [Brachybacterium endophyticum]